MSTITITVEEAARNLRDLIRRVFRDGDNAVITESGRPVAEIVPARAARTESAAPAQGRACIAQDELTGLPVIVPPEGTPPLTSEAVRAALTDFP